MSMGEHETDVAGPPTASSDDGFGLVRDQWGQLALVDADGVRHHNVTVVPLFPISDPEHWISICDADGEEIVCVADPAKLAPDTYRVLKDEMSHREFAPIVERINRVSSALEPSEWDVQTDRGRTRFVLQSDEKVRRLGANTVAIEDANGIRYLIPDVRKLDATSQRIIEWYV
jgi:hypothetical protein